MKGFTIVEMMVALAIAIVICLIAIPSFLKTETETKGSAAKAQLLSQLQQAQQIANEQNTEVKVCLSKDGRTCTPENASMIILLSNTDIKASCYIKGRGTLHLRSYPYYRDYILVKPTVAGNSDNGTFWYCSKENILQWSITMSQSGEPEVHIATDGVIDGSTIRCVS